MKSQIGYKDSLNLKQTASVPAARMPRRGHLTGLRAGSVRSDSESGSDSESDSEARQHPPAAAGLGVLRIVRAPARFVVNTQVQCPGCGGIFASLHILKAHRNSYRLANAACRAAATAMKRSRPVPRASDGDGPGDAQALIDRMMGNGDRGKAPEDSDVQDHDPARYPSRHGDEVSEPNNVCIMCASCLHIVCTY